jgi:hypothetical protein
MRGWILVLVALFVAAPVSATLVAIEEAYELYATQLTLPARPDAQLTIRRCRDCRVVALRVTPRTAWFLHPDLSRPQSQAAVLAAFKPAATNADTMVYVYYEPRTRRVTRIVVDLPASQVRP